MEGLIKITEQKGQKVVSARELHKFIDSKQEFANWIKNRIEKYGFEEGADYEILHFDYLGNLLNIRPDKFIRSENQRVAKTDYVLTIDTAKELSMVENNEKGKQARRYFISIEKKYIEQLKALAQPKVIEDYSLEQEAIDITSDPYYFQRLSDKHTIRYVMYDNTRWYLIRDFLEVFFRGSQSKSVARAMVKKNHKVRRFLMSGEYHPTWFANKEGINHLILRSRQVKDSAYNVDLYDFVSKTDKELEESDTRVLLNSKTIEQLFGDTSKEQDAEKTLKQAMILLNDSIVKMTEEIKKLNNRI
ncbi:antA/AntB antirepressor family protein [Capnocytophaga canis]|uniref:antA/AntB antirepressor family protein n=2 Tax=Capnocytophaga canis TaxID=1848903 RepID=UPI001561EDAF|nr:antA/AntB antirepressor family protein [Capnocytophaga canis]